jgi:hypothetical protein
LSRKPGTSLAFLVAIAASVFVSSDGRLLFCFLPLFGIGFSLFLLRSGRLNLVTALMAAIGFSALCSHTLGTREAITGLLAAALILIPVRRSIPVLSWEQFHIRSI